MQICVVNHTEVLSFTMKFDKTLDICLFSFLQGATFYNLLVIWSISREHYFSNDENMLQEAESYNT